MSWHADLCVPGQRVYLHLCLISPRYEVRDTQPWDQRGQRVIQSKHHHYNSPSRPKGPESWRAKITWPNRKIPSLASTVHHGTPEYSIHTQGTEYMHCVSTALEGSPIRNDQVMMLPVEKKEKKKNCFCHIDIRIIQSRVWRPPQPKGHFRLAQPEDTAFCTPTGSRLKEAVGED